MKERERYYHREGGEGGGNLERSNQAGMQGERKDEDGRGGVTKEVERQAERPADDEVKVEMNC